MQINLFPIACVVLASGIGRRFGANKLLKELDGKPLVQHILDITTNILAERVTITRHSEIKNICDERAIACVLHSEPYLSDTVRLGVEYIEAQQKNIQGILFATADQPLLKQNTLIRLCASFLQQPEKIHRLYFNDIPGNPIIFPLRMAAELKHLPQDKGGSVLAKKYPELVIKVQAQDKNELFDIDTKEDLRKLEH